MKLILTENSVCELMYRMRDAMIEDRLSAAILLSREIHNKLTEMIANKESMQMCTRL